jgi:alkylation response protein AidB-like acyl-CoA dehydrogenase
LCCILCFDGLSIIRFSSPLELHSWTARRDAAGRGGIKAFVVPAGTPGMSIVGLERKLGIRASDTATLRFEGMPAYLMSPSARDPVHAQLPAVPAGEVAGHRS